jgi:hypothetical protein
LTLDGGAGDFNVEMLIVVAGRGEIGEIGDERRRRRRLGDSDGEALLSVRGRELKLERRIPRDWGRGGVSSALCPCSSTKKPRNAYHNDP